MKSLMIISIDVEKTFDKIKHPFLMKTLSWLGVEENFLSLIIPTANIILDGEGLNVFPQEQVQNKDMCSLLLFSLVRRFQLVQ